MPIESWLPILKWSSVPNFTTVHDLPDTKRFLTLYYDQDPEFKAFVGKLLEGLRGEEPLNAVRIEGYQGWGKTTSFYYLMATGGIGSNFHFAIIHARKLIGKHGLDSEAADEMCLDVLTNYFESCAPDRSVLEAIRANEELSIAKKRNRLVEYLKKHKRQFKRRLVVILDDVDLLRGEDQVLSVVEYIFGALQAATIIKWLAVRQLTYENYGHTTAEQIDTFFPHVVRFPDIRLYHIARRRIEDVMTGDDSINPFDQMLCTFIEDVHNGDHRVGLAIIRELLMENPPGEIKPGRTNQEFVSRYMRRMVLKTCVERGSIPNIFTPYGNVNTVLPLAKEVMSLCYVRRRFDDEFVRLVNESLTQKTIKILRAKAEFSSEDIAEALVFLEDQLNLIEFNNGSTLDVTERGYIFQTIIETAYYAAICKDRLKKRQPSEQFWAIAGISSYFRDTILIERKLQEPLSGDVDDQINKA